MPYEYWQQNQNTLRKAGVSDAAVEGFVRYQYYEHKQHFTLPSKEKRDRVLLNLPRERSHQRMMEYDRAMVNAMGGKLVAIESRTNPAVTGRFRMAIRRQSDTRPDLIPLVEIQD